MMSAKAKSKAKAEPVPDPEQGQGKVSFFPAWCKQCGNCVAFCPRRALAQDEWGHPYLADSDRCTSCGLCEMLCPDFAISVGDVPHAGGPAGPAREKPAAGAPIKQSPERLAPSGSEE
jgi:2-oxoglutarate ferredoxin oxidoreductase subunit delta